MKKLLKIEISYETVVFADKENDYLIKDLIMDSISQEKKSIEIIEKSEIKSFKDIPKNWDLGSIPWGMEDDSTIGQFLSENISVVKNSSPIKVEMKTLNKLMECLNELNCEKIEVHLK